MSPSPDSSTPPPFVIARGSAIWWVFVILAVAGLLLPWVFNVQYFLAGGHVLPGIFLRDVAANDLTLAITIDVYLAACAFSAWVVHERRVRRRWLYVVACFGLGLAFAWPLYLLRRRDVRASPSA